MTNDSWFIVFFSQYYYLSESEGFKIILANFSISWKHKNQACADTINVGWKQKIPSCKL